MFRHPLVSALLALGLTVLVSMPHPAHAQTAQAASQKPVLTTLHRFDDKYGANPYTRLTLGADGDFYGVTFYGGLNNQGTIFKMTPQGKFITLFAFNGANGAQPYGQLVQGADGAFYGTTTNIQYGSGTAFRITTEGRFTILHTFGGADGGSPYAGLTPAPDGSFYGVTYSGGANNRGTMFHMTPVGAITTLHSFGLNDGQRPAGSLVFGPDGALYGTASEGGDNNTGMVFRITTAGVFSMLHSFTNNGAYPYAGLTVGTDGAFYGVAANGGLQNSGTAFRITAAGAFTTLHKFSRDGHGVIPMTALTLGTDGSFYGTTYYGGTGTKLAGNVGAGTVFQMTPSGQVATLYKFHTKFDGFYPNGGVAFGPDGALYGATEGGGSKGFGTLYKLTLPQ